MSRQEILEQLKELLYLMNPDYRKLGDSLTEDTSLINDLGFSSVSFLYMLFAVEERFKISFDDGKQFQTVKEVVDYIEEKLR